MSFANAVFSAVFVPSPPEPKLIPFCFLSGFPVGAWLLYALPSITYTGWRVIPFCPIWGDFRNHLRLYYYKVNPLERTLDEKSSSLNHQMKTQRESKFHNFVTIVSHIHSKTGQVFSQELLACFTFRRLRSAPALIAPGTRPGYRARHAQSCGCTMGR